jgi:hypothetical protein
MSRDVLLARPDVDERNFAGADPPHELIVGNRLQRAASFQVLARDVLDFCQARLRQTAQVKKEVAHLWVREPIRHIQTCFVGIDQAGTSKHLEVMGSRCDAPARLPGERFDGAVSLRQEVEELETARACHGLADARDLLVDRLFQ